ncbi:TonB-dependent receptor domain-containing protein [Sphingomonas aliaeris]|uniref:TonB-dependent receptor domain-containing protein n=1 Tax=Sphingomonas aliaeris TaxID=2759526 RepID=UPI001CED8818|nr:TonB-dependent receptor [Sphingomonas aliaeris]
MACPIPASSWRAATVRTVAGWSKRRRGANWAADSTCSPAVIIFANAAGAISRRPKRTSCSASSAGPRPEHVSRCWAALPTPISTATGCRNSACSRATGRASTPSLITRRTARRCSTSPPTTICQIRCNSRATPFIATSARAPSTATSTTISLGENLYQPSAAERTALTRAGITGFPLSGETQANTPFPRFRCIANALINSEPNEKCNGLINRSATRQHEFGGTAELALTAPVGGMDNRLTIGTSYVRSKAVFTQTAQFGYLTPARAIVAVTGPGAFADGTQDSENAFDARVDLSGRTTGFSLYGTDSLSLSRTLKIDLSARFDHTVVKNRDRMTPGGGTGSLDGDHRFNKLNPAIAIAWNPSAAFGIDGAIAQTSRAPSAIELGCADPESPCRLPNALAGDPPLDQVVATTFEGGVHGAAKGLTWRIGAFRADSRDDILFVADDQAGFGYFRNFGRTRRQGIDVDASYALGPVRLSAHYTYLDATYRSPETVGGSANSSNEGPAPGFEGEIDIEKGDRIPLIPRDVFKASIGWDALRQVSLNLDMIAVSGATARGNENGEHRPDGVYYLGEGRTKGYAVFNLGVDVRPIERVTLFAQVNNLFDREYATAAQLAATGFDATGNFVARPFAGPVIGGERPLLGSTFFAPGAPRWVQVGAKLRF